MAKLNNPDQPPNDGKIRLPSVDNAMNRVAPNRLSGGKGSRNDNRFVALGAQRFAGLRKRYHLAGW